MGLFTKIVKVIPKEVEQVNDSQQTEIKSIVIKESTPDCEYPILEREILPEKVKCPKCGFFNLEGIDKCARCGTVISD